MSTYEHDLLTARFAALATRPLPGDWDDVLDRAGTVRQRRRRLARSLWHTGHRRKLVVALAVAVLVPAVAAAAYGAVRVLFLDKGFIGLPPVGATPSTPESGELEVFYWVSSPQLRRPPTWSGDGNVGRSRAWVYADGRLIWLREATVPEGANRWTTGFLEQRLTPEGVERLRSEVISHAVACRTNTGGCGARVRVRDGNSLIPVRWARNLGHRDLVRLETRLSDPSSWLPASAWEDRKISPYVPSRFAACYTQVAHESSNQARILTRLPSTAQDLLRAKDTKRVTQFYGDKPGSFNLNYHWCSDLTTDEARVLSTALDDAGVAREDRLWLAYSIPASRERLVAGTILIYFEPYLPHGEWTCSPCG
jgi:hypothetical protein